MFGSTSTANSGVTSLLGVRMEGKLISELSEDEYTYYLRKVINFDSANLVYKGLPAEVHLRAMKEKATLLVQLLAFKRQELRWDRFNKDPSNKGLPPASGPGSIDYVKKARTRPTNLISSYTNSFNKIGAEDQQSQKSQQAAAEQQVADYILGTLDMHGMNREDIDTALNMIELRNASGQEAIRSLVQVVRTKLPWIEARGEAGQASSQPEADQARPQVEANQAQPQAETEKMDDMMALASKAVAVLQRQSQQRKQ